MKIIFLDVDGVLNSEEDILKAGIGKGLYDEISDDKLKRLKKLVGSTNAKIVVSSTWRIGCARSGDKSFYGEKLFKSLEDKLASVGLEILDITPVINKPMIKRGDEIRQWLQTTKYDIESFVILDDDSDMCEFTGTNLVKTSNKVGLTDADILIAEEILNRNDIDLKAEISKRIARIWDKRPEWRFGQLIVNIFGTDPFYLTDKGSLQRLEQFECDMN